MPLTVLLSLNVSCKIELVNNVLLESSITERKGHEYNPYNILYSSHKLRVKNDVYGGNIATSFLS